MRSDLELLAGWQEGDRAAGSELFRRYFDPLYRFFATKLPDETEDLVQSTWMACVRYGERVAQAASFRAYLFTVARNELYRALRSRRPAGVDLGVSSVVDLAPSPATIAGSAQRERRLLGALRALPVQAQVILELYYWEELSTRELAEVLEVPLGTAKSQLRRAKQLLHQGLERDDAQAPADDALDRWVQSMRAKIVIPPGG